MATLRLSLAAAACIALHAGAPAHDGAHAPARGKARLPFVPPPMEGTLSLGIYAPDGRLVRTVAAMAAVEDPAFDQEPDGLVAWWDGLDDAGNPAPPGSYHARGFCVGDLAVEGAACHGNDWFEGENPPRIARILGFERLPDGSPAARYEAPGGQSGTLPLSAPPTALIPTPPAPVAPPLDPAAERAIDVSPGDAGSTWAVVERDGLRELRAYAADGTFLRRLAAAEGRTMARVIGALDRPEVFLLEEDAGGQRVRGMRPASAAPENAEPGTSVWEEFFDRSIRFAPTPEEAKAFVPSLADGSVELARSAGLALVPNPLFRDARGACEVRVEAGPDGSRLVAADGLPLAAIGSTPGLRWASLARIKDRKHLVLFQSDGAVVEEFHIFRPANMMAFEVGEVILPPRDGSQP